MSLEETLTIRDLDQLNKQFFYFNPQDGYGVYRLLLKPAQLAIPFEQFSIIFSENYFDLPKTIAELLGVNLDFNLQQVINTLKLYKNPLWYMAKSIFDPIKVEFLGGNNQLYKSFVDCNNFGLIKSLENPGKQSKEAYFLCNESIKLFIKPYDNEKIAKNELRAYEDGVKMGLEDYLLPICLVKLNKSDKYAIVAPVLPNNYQSLQDLEKSAKGSTDGLIDIFVRLGEAHKIALYDLIIKNCDRHKGNIFSDGLRLMLIDNGLAYQTAGYKKWFPGYLRNSEFKKSQKLPIPDCDYNIISDFVNKIKDLDLKNAALDILSYDLNPFVAINKGLEKFIKGN